jgi:hypothetical protein
MVMVADTGTTIAAAFAAVAATAAWATVATDWWRQRQARQPNVSAGLLRLPNGSQKIEFVNMGPGLAIKLGYLLYVGGPGGQRVGSVVGTGHLQTGERAVIDLPVGVPGQTADFVWVCRDIDQRLHIWSYSGDHKHLKRGRYPNLGDAFRLMYPKTPLPPRNVGMLEDSTTPGEAVDGDGE